MRPLLTAMLLIPNLSCAAGLQDSEIFTPESINSGMSAEYRGYRFEIIENGGNKYLSAKSPSGTINKVKVEDPAASRFERIFIIESHGCGSNTIDAVIQIGPTKYSDLIYRSYYRILFSKDLRTVVSKFYDPSESEIYAILPIQSIENLKNKETNRAIICEGSKPVVKELAASGAKNKEAPSLGKIILQDKAPLYTSPSQNSITKSYLVKGDTVSLTTKEINGFFKFKYKAKSGKIIENWIQCESIASCSKDSSNSDK